MPVGIVKGRGGGRRKTGAAREMGCTFPPFLSATMDIGSDRPTDRTEKKGRGRRAAVEFNFGKFLLSTHRGDGGEKRGAA